MRSTVRSWVMGVMASCVLTTTSATYQVQLSKRCCHALASNARLRGKVLYPNSTAYEARIDSIWSLDAALEPWCIVLPQSTEDTVEVITTITRNQCPFGIRSGGHGTFNNSNSVQDGVTIDFGFMNTTTYDEKTNTASIQAGSRWGSAYEQLQEQSVGVAGGGQLPVGVAGFLLGGGMSFVNNAYGFGCDTIKNMQVVLANGSIVDANADVNRDLWIALKGGSGNFGLVTRFDLEAVPLARNATQAGLMFGGVMSWNISAIDQVLDAMVDFTSHVPEDPATSSHIIAGYASPGGWLILGALENKDNVDPPAFDRYKALPGQLGSTLRTDSLYNFAKEFSGAARSYGVWIPGMVSNDAEIQKYLYDRFEVMAKQMVDLIPANSTWSVLLQLQPISLPMIAAGHGTNSIGLDREVAAGRGPGIMTSLLVSVETKELEDKVHPLMLECQNDFDKFAAERDALWSWRYLNYADFSYDPIASYGNESVARMRHVSAQYDPNGVFQKLRKSGFKIPQ